MENKALQAPHGASFWSFLTTSAAIFAPPCFTINDKKIRQFNNLTEVMRGCNRFRD
jgi:hypothetical protein